MQKGDKLWNIKFISPETRAFKSTCNITKKACTDGENPTKNLIFEWPVTLSKWKDVDKVM